jgi:hypothetical protein
MLVSVRDRSMGARSSDRRAENVDHFVFRVILQKKDFFFSMSLSLSFELEADDSAAAHPPVISSPVQIGAQPVLSESLAGYEPLDDHWKLWRVPAGPYESFRRKPLMTQDQLKKTLRESPHYFSPGVEGLFRVLTQRPLANGSSPSKYGKINLFSAHEAMQKGEVQNLLSFFWIAQ